MAIVYLKKRRQKEKKIKRNKFVLLFNTIHKLCLVHSPLLVADDVDAEDDDAEVDQDDDHPKDVGQDLHGEAGKLLPSTL